MHNAAQSGPIHPRSAPITNPSPENTTRRHPLAQLAIAALAAALLALSPVPAGAQPQPLQPAGLAVVSYASDYGVSHAEAQRRLDRIPPLQEILASIREAEGARLAGWGIDHAGTFTGWVWLTGQQPPQRRGGPWHDRGYAFGIHGGSTGGRNCTMTGVVAYFSAIRDVERALGVDILTTGPFTVQ